MILGLYIIFYLSALLWKSDSKRLKFLLCCNIALAQFVHILCLFTIPLMVCLPILFLRGAQVFVRKNYLKLSELCIEGLLLLGFKEFRRAKYLMTFFAAKECEQPNYIYCNNLEKSVLEAYISTKQSQVARDELVNTEFESFLKSEAKDLS